jgi:hypothetical protein
MSGGVMRGCSQLDLLFVAITAAQIMAMHGVSGSDGCVSVGGVASMNECDLRANQSKPLRVAYLDKQYVTQNQVVISKMKALNTPYVFASTCEKEATAIPEWYCFTNLQFTKRFLLTGLLQLCSG